MLRFATDAAEAGGVVDSVVRDGAASVPVLEEGERQRLLHEAQQLPFEGASGDVGAYGVRQEMSVCRVIPVGSALRQTADAVGAELGEIFDVVGGVCDDESAFAFNELTLQRYPSGSTGISPHRDGKRYRCIIAILVIAGEAAFAVCRDRDGSEPVSIDARAGRLVLLRAPGFRGTEERPFHFVSDVTAERFVLTLRFDSSRETSLH